MVGLRATSQAGADRALMTSPRVSHAHAVLTIDLDAICDNWKALRRRAGHADCGAVVKANLQGTLSGAGPFTVFAPTNDAFAAIQSTVAGLTIAQLTKVLTYHVLPAQVLAANIPFGTPMTTVEGETLTINAGPPPPITDKTATPAAIVATDVRAGNGVIHVIGKVLIPTL